MFSIAPSFLAILRMKGSSSDQTWAWSSRRSVMRGTKSSLLSLSSRAEISPSDTFVSSTVGRPCCVKYLLVRFSQRVFWSRFFCAFSERSSFFASLQLDAVVSVAAALPAAGEDERTKVLLSCWTS